MHFKFISAHIAWLVNILALPVLPYKAKDISAYFTSKQILPFGFAMCASLAHTRDLVTDINLKSITVIITCLTALCIFMSAFASPVYPRDIDPMWGQC